MPRLMFETQVRGPVVLVTLRGELDMLATADIERELARLTDEPRFDVIALDLRALDFLDSTGLRTILLARNRLEDEDRRLVLVRGPRAVQRVFELTRTTERLEFVDAPEHVAI